MARWPPRPNFGEPDKYRQGKYGEDKKGRGKPCPYGFCSLLIWLPKIGAGGPFYSPTSYHSVLYCGPTVNVSAPLADAAGTC